MRLRIVPAGRSPAALAGAVEAAPEPAPVGARDGNASRVRTADAHVADPARHVLRGRLARVSVRAAMAAGGWVGLGLGLILGAVLGALLSWFAGAALQWQHDLGLTLGVAQTLLPLGDQIPALGWVADNWYLVIPVTGAILGLVGAILAGLVAGLVAAGYNRASRHTVVLVEVPEATLVGAAAAALTPAAPEHAAAKPPIGATADAAIDSGPVPLAEVPPDALLRLPIALPGDGRPAVVREQRPPAGAEPVATAALPAASGALPESKAS